jgi:hypothetical protein
MAHKAGGQPHLALVLCTLNFVVRQIGQANSYSTPCSSALLLYEVLGAGGAAAALADACTSRAALHMLKLFDPSAVLSIEHAH